MSNPMGGCNMSSRKSIDEIVKRKLYAESMQNANHIEKRTAPPLFGEAARLKSLIELQ